MSINIGKNTSGLFNKDLLIGENIGKASSKEEALKLAKANEGSEIIYKKDGEWHVDQVEQEGLFANSPISGKDSDKVKIKMDILNGMGMSEPVMSFVEDSDYFSRSDIASTTNSSKELNLLSNDSDYMVRKDVALNKNTSLETLLKLASDENPEVRAAVAINPNINDEIIQILQNDNDDRVINSLRNLV